RHADRRLDRLAAGGGEGESLVPGHRAGQLGDLTEQIVLDADGKAALELLAHGLDDEVGRMAEEVGPEPESSGDVLVPIDVPDARAIRALRDDLVDELLPGGVEADDR